jgi:uncharacterized repeat protein (TIGR03803 family)
MRSQTTCITTLKAVAVLFALLLVILPKAWSRDNEKVLYSFTGSPDGSFPFENSLILDGNGNLYGTTASGGAYGGGTVFELSPKAGGGWKENVLYSFWAYNQPSGRLILDSKGNLYGTTSGLYPGVVFELSPSGAGTWVESDLYEFSGGSDGGYPNGGVVFDSKGNLYGTTEKGGDYCLGTIFEVSPKAGGGWAETVLHSFNGADGDRPWSDLILDAAGHFYGTTTFGGDYSSGTVFELAPKTGGGWTETVLHSFNGTDGSGPLAGVILDQAGNLYGTTEDGGNGTYDGTAFELMPDGSGHWTPVVLHKFGGEGDGRQPTAKLTLDAKGNLYGTTLGGGLYEKGTVFELAPKAGGGWTEKVLHHFSGGIDGGGSDSTLVSDNAGNLYGTTQSGGGANDGIVFEMNLGSFPFLSFPLTAISH